MKRHRFALQSRAVRARGEDGAMGAAASRGAGSGAAASAASSGSSPPQAGGGPQRQGRWRRARLVARAWAPFQTNLLLSSFPRH